MLVFIEKGLVMTTSDLTPQQLLIAIQNTVNPVQNRSQEVLQAWKNEKALGKGLNQYNMSDSDYGTKY